VLFVAQAPGESAGESVCRKQEKFGHKGGISARKLPVFGKPAPPSAERKDERERENAEEK
jgi:hypothetical protein